MNQADGFQWDFPYHPVQANFMLAIFYLTQEKLLFDQCLNLRIYFW